MDKDKYMDFVFLFPGEHEKLVEKFGVKGTHERIEALNDYIGSVGKRYKSHYYTILNWERRNCKANKKIMLYPVKGKFCEECGMPAKWKSTGAYDNWYCADHMPDKVKEKYE